MTSEQLKDTGFLSADCLTNTLGTEVKQAKFYEVACELNAIAQGILNKAAIHPDDRKEVYASLYYQRLLSHYQGIILMAERGMTHQMEVLLRCMLGILFDLRAFSSHEDVFEALINGDDEKRREVLQNLEYAQQASPTFTEEERTKLRKVISSVDEIDRDDFTVFMKAELAGMLNEYRTTYTWLTQAVHTSLNSLTTDIRFSTDDEIIEIDTCAQSSDEVAELLLTAANYLLEALETMTKTFPHYDSLDAIQNVKSRVAKAWQSVVVAVNHR